VDGRCVVSNSSSNSSSNATPQNSRGRNPAEARVQSSISRVVMVVECLRVAGKQEAVRSFVHAPSGSRLIILVGTRLSFLCVTTLIAAGSPPAKGTFTSSTRLL
jgi:hypothetical protein